MTGTLLAPRRRAFSLIELLIVVAILSALVGVAVPFFQSYTREAQVAKARRDLDVLRDAILRWEFQSRGFLGGGSLAPLLNGAMQEIPRDPWSNDYFLDGNLGVVGSFGQNGVQFGQGGDEDIVVQYKTYVVPLEAHLTGGFGPPREGHRLSLQLSKPVEVLHPDLVPHDMVILPPIPNALPIPTAYWGFEYSAEHSRPSRGLLAVEIPAGASLADPLANIPIAQGALLTVANGVVSLEESPAPVAKTGIEDPSPYLWGTRPSIQETGRWDGPVLRR